MIFPLVARPEGGKSIGREVRQLLPLKKENDKKLFQ
jgi:hypothetical protein